ncbi:MMPL family transporter [Adhaeribacter sp. BT258]|uniref:MMPL family transporter n=1 Tax=Adhaeribacter terrigena TaxID=2793070 RepID=A0ABS1C4L8_9BACT|nr:MMPL family transporter [Adhaeribacter terrigena]MBK0403578.1 MMPL family transporter [Adhaeribacter terrigena]
MWKNIALFILKNRIALILALAVSTAFMAWKAKDVEMSYDFANVVSKDDTDMVYFQRFKQTFGEDGNVLVVGMHDSAVFDLKNFRELKKLSDAVSHVEGVKAVISLPGLVSIQKDTTAKTFAPKKIFEPFPQTQKELHALLQTVKDQKFYEGLIINEQTSATLLAITVDPKFLNSARRVEVMDHITKHTEVFSRKTGIKMHYAGLPFVRAVMTTKVAGEMKLFLALAMLVTAVTLFLTFRSWSAVIFPLLVISVVVIWTLGTIALLGYKISLLTGLIPSIIVVIGIPNCTYLLAHYHLDYRKHGNKMLAMARVLSKLGLVTFINNATTAIGFIVFMFTDIAILYEFGVVAGINTFVTYLVCVILIPVVFSYLPPPTEKQLRHLDAKPLTKLLEFFQFIVLQKRYLIYFFTILISALSVWGIFKMKTVAYMVDDLPAESSVNADLKFFERHFAGVMPLEIVIDTGVKQGVMKLNNLKKIDQLENFLRTQPILSAPISVAGLVKTATQAFYNGDPSSFRLPDNTERNFIFSYLAKQGGGENKRLLRSFVDSTGQSTRISLRVADVGSRELDTLLINKLKPEIRKIWGGEGIVETEEGNTMTFQREGSDNKQSVSLTGTTLLFIKGNNYLIDSLGESLVQAFIMVTIIIIFLFRSSSAVVITLIPNIIPLIMVAGLMGFLGIPLKPSTALIFTIALGITVDNTVHFLAKYRLDLAANGFNVREAIISAIGEAGTSMIYTTVTLFFGFVIFAFSEFGGTKALGILMSLTLLIALFTNLIVLPALLVSFDKGRYTYEPNAPIQDYDEYSEENDADVDLDMLEIKQELEPVSNSREV